MAVLNLVYTYSGTAATTPLLKKNVCTSALLLDCTTRTVIFIANKSWTF
jgi:hypothetical protein